ncbi:hypothetical protein GCM10010222_35290 [Streptomyces tanashiensis]|uniref:hypothetical protein n=1 Tax=Streptomyces tanashiensis TaxID=67367 RepID=UPI0016797804|nr:hypothetical protein [Streptomyces tanashiensis]GGS90623.1 hypothetical protein GCM10010222_35290 [Streptomyces tanashiensis]
MRALPAEELLRLWDEYRDASPHTRALALAAAADEDTGSVPPAERPIGRVTALLLRLREALAGPRMAATVGCPACRGTVEFQATTEALLALEDKIVDAPPPLAHGGHEVAWRCLTYRDLRAVAEHPEAADPHRGALLLLERCLLGLRHQERTLDPAAVALPDAVREALTEAMSAADPLADVLIDLTCPDCAHAFTADFDVAAFVWAELDSRGRQLLLDVDTLARSYGWSETEVLALSERRRASYLRIVTGELP